MVISSRNRIGLKTRKRKIFTQKTVSRGEKNRIMKR